MRLAPQFQFGNIDRPAEETEKSKRRRFLFSVLLIAASVSSITISSAANSWAVTLQPDETTSKDTFAYQFLSTLNFNLPPFNNLLTAGKTTTGHDTQSLLQFDIGSTGLTSAQVTSATLQIYAVDSVAAGFGLNPTAGAPIQLDLYAVGGATPTWTESDVTWGTLPSTTGAAVASAPLGGINQWVSFDITNLVKQWLDGSLANNGLLLQQNAAVGSPGAFVVGVFDSAAGTNHPMLTIVPEPSSYVLAAVAALGIVCCGRWKVVRRS